MSARIRRDASSLLPPTSNTGGFWRNLPGIGRLFGKMEMISERQHERRHLSELTEEELKDIGLTRAEARHEGDRHFWD